MSIADNIRKLREEHGLTQKELGDIAGVSDKAVSSWERGAKDPRMGAIQRLADHFGMTKSNIIEGTPAVLPPCLELPPDFSIPKIRKIPLVRGFSEGDMVAQYADRSVFAPETIQADYALRCKDESLTAARILPGDILFIRRQARIENGGLAVFDVNGDVLTRRLYRYPDQIILIAENPEISPLVFAGRDQGQVRPLGAIVAFVSSVF